mmetsp:Transcript_4385/g.10614  ORF Transcript_4385/g.10614 Transcript_4385/m.10614 type:complete len:278 (-) Transcript_4385:15-848(-)
MLRAALLPPVPVSRALPLAPRPDGPCPPHRKSCSGWANDDDRASAAGAAVDALLPRDPARDDGLPGVRALRVDAHADAPARHPQVLRHLRHLPLRLFPRSLHRLQPRQLGHDRFPCRHARFLPGRPPGGGARDGVVGHHGRHHRTRQLLPGVCRPHQPPHRHDVVHLRRDQPGRKTTMGPGASVDSGHPRQQPSCRRAQRRLQQVLGGGREGWGGMPVHVVHELRRPCGLPAGERRYCSRRRRCGEVMLENFKVWSIASRRLCAAPLRSGSFQSLQG